MIQLTMERRKFLQTAAVLLGAGVLVSPKPTQAEHGPITDVELRSILRDADLLAALNKTRADLDLPPFEINDQGKLYETQREIEPKKSEIT